MEKIFELTEDEFVRFRGRVLPGSRQARFCSFGITESIGAIVASIGADVGTAAAVDAGVDAATDAGIETVIDTAPSLVGAGISASDVAGLTVTGLGLDAALSTPALAAPATGAAAVAGGTGGGITGSTGTPALGTAPTDTSSTLTSLGSTPTTPTVAGPTISPGGASALTTPNATALPGPATGVAGGGSSAISGGGLGGSGLGTEGLTPDLTAGTTGGGGLSGGAGAAPSVGSVGGGAGAAGITPNAVSFPAFDPSSLEVLPSLPASSNSGGLLAELGINNAGDAVKLGGSVLGGANAISGILGANQTASQVQNALGTVTAAQATQAQEAGNLNNSLNALTPTAASEAASGATLEGYLSSGTLPPGAQAAINQATSSAIASVKSKYASLGLSGSTMETQDINSINEQAASQVVTLATNLYNTGISQTGLANQLYSAIMGGQQDILNQDTSVIGEDTSAVSALSANNNTANAAIANYAAALAKTG